MQENNLCIIPKSKWRKVFPLQRRFLQEIQFAGYVVVPMRVTICFRYSLRPVQLKIYVRKFKKKHVGSKFLRTIRGQRGQQCCVGLALPS